MKLLRKLNLIQNYYSVNVIKNIPVFSGLGGGTSNAAFILKFLLKNKITDNKISSLNKNNLIFIMGDHGWSFDRQMMKSKNLEDNRFKTFFS